MIDLIDYKEIRFECQDLTDLRMLLKQLLGQPFRFFKVSYGEEVRLHLGDFRAYSSPRMRGRKRGSYIVGARASSWLIFSVPRHTLATSTDVQVFDSGSDKEAAHRQVPIKTIETGNFITAGSVVIMASADRMNDGFVLRLEFSDGSKVLVTPSSEGVDDEAEEGGQMEIADWEILTPHDRTLLVGPAGRWGYLDSTKASD